MYEYSAPFGLAVAASTHSLEEGAGGSSRRRDRRATHLERPTDTGASEETDTGKGRHLDRQAS
jgi:hypothetical protein